ESEAKRSEFEQNARAIIESNITDIDFDVDDLAEEMMMSRSTLYRRARTNKAPSPASLIREVRMKRAHDLLATGEGSVTEVAYAIGYESLASFSGQFSAHFGYPPSQVSRREAT
ncbi:MAG: helix-turn-helix transcriptional regulator, partial [Longimonas sp.]|uniref:helix-turn-helix transcriptional regulator n=1 Tax=Longimonas sp. TaxID=2039626 RepID=UPI00334EF7A0